jgi:putative glutamine amidotransferase
MRKPVIGITAKQDSPEWVKRELNYYIEAVITAGATPLIIAPNRTAPTTELPLARLSGLLISGGADINPKSYGEEPNGAYLSEIDLMRDQLEITLVRLAAKQNLPILGICRGHQVINVAFGGTLKQDIPGHMVEGHDGPKWLQHSVRLLHGSKIQQILGLKSVLVNSRHHQVVTNRRLASQLTATAYSETEPEYIESIESSHHTWLLGVQWHPERTPEVPDYHAKLFTTLVQAARNYQTALLPAQVS